MAADSFRILIHRKINEGRLEAHRERARMLTAGVEATEPDTLCYEWYPSEAGDEYYLIETYADSAAFLLHMSHLKQLPPSPPDIGPILEALVFGSPSAEAREAMSFLKAKFLPPLVGCTRDIGRTDVAGDSFRLMLHQRIDEGQVEVFKKNVTELTERAEASEPDTLCYEWYLSEDGADGYVVEWYTSSEAFLLHQTHLKEIPRTGPSVGPIMEVVVLGSPSAELREQFAQRGARVFPLLVGCTR